MTASRQAKAQGLKSLAQVSQMTGQDVEKLIRWAKDRPELFNIILQGCVRVLTNKGKL